MSGILCDQAILDAIQSGEISISPFDVEQLNITSYDLTLGKEVRVYTDWVGHTPSTVLAKTGVLSPSSLKGVGLYPRSGHIIDSKKEPASEAWGMPDDGFLLQPGIGYLCHSKEVIWSDRYNPIIDGKSSIGRLFIKVHATAGYADPGFRGNITLEIEVAHPVIVYPGMRIAQIRFHEVLGTPTKLYNQVGHYTADAAKGAIPSQAWKQFK